LIKKVTKKSRQISSSTFSLERKEEPKVQADFDAEIVFG